MKEAFIGVGLLLLFAISFALMSLFGNITVTDQLNYTTMKNAVQAAMFDSVDMAKYRSGFCLCTKNSNFVFNSSSEYEIKNLVNNGCDPKDLNYSGNCKLQIGEYKIIKEVFAESFARRFAEMVNNNKNYRLYIDRVIEYPPKASVRVESDDKYGLVNDKNPEDNDFSIVNELNGIIEEIDSVN